MVLAAIIDLKLAMEFDEPFGLGAFLGQKPPGLRTETMVCGPCNSESLAGVSPCVGKLVVGKDRRLERFSDRWENLHSWDARVGYFAIRESADSNQVR